MPALVKSRVGSLLGTREELSMTLCPFFSKYLRKRLRISAAFIPTVYRDEGRLSNGVHGSRPSGAGCPLLPRAVGEFYIGYTFASGVRNPKGATPDDLGSSQMLNKCINRPPKGGRSWERVGKVG